MPGAATPLTSIGIAIRMVMASGRNVNAIGALERGILLRFVLIPGRKRSKLINLWCIFYFGHRPMLFLVNEMKMGLCSFETFLIYFGFDEVIKFVNLFVTVKF